MLADIKYWESDAQNKHYAIAHFNVCGNVNGGH